MGILLKYQQGGPLGAYDLLVDSVIKKKGGSKKDYEDLMGKIGYHESKYIVHTDDGKSRYKYMDYKAKQQGGGPGRGLFMFEEGENAGGITAAKRTYRYMKTNNIRIPVWLDKAVKQKSLDASTLGEYEQKMLFLGNYMGHPEADMGKVVKGEQDVSEFWGKYHQTQNDPEKLKNFEKDSLQWKRDHYIENELASDPLNQFKRGGILKYQKGNKLSKENTGSNRKNIDDLYNPLYEKLESAYEVDSYNDIINHKDIHPNTAIWIDRAFGYSLNDISSEKRKIPKLDKDLKELHNKLLKMPNDKLRELLKEDYSKLHPWDIGKINNIAKSMDIGIIDTMKYRKAITNKLEEGYTFKKGGILKYQDGGSILKNINAKYPAFKNMGEVTIKADPEFTRDKTGVGSIEYFGIQDNRDRVTYGNGYSYPHPKKGTHGIVYDPKTNNEQSIMLDMLHGMTSDTVYNKHRDEFKKTFLERHKSDFEADWEREREEYGEGDGKEQFKENWIDGHIRGLMFEGTPEEFKKAKYWPEAREVYLKDKDVNKKFNQLKNYLKTGNAYTLPEFKVTPKDSEKILPKLRKGGKPDIYIKPSKRGSLRSALGIEKGKTIPVSKLEIKPSDTLAMRKKKTFAKNSRKWKH